jgi:hypothetical protein
MATQTPLKPRPKSKKEPTEPPTLKDFDAPFEFEMCDLRDLFIDKYQRRLTSFVTTIAREFDPLMVGTLVVSERRGGKKAIVDGQHRFEAMKSLDYQTFPCIVFRGLSPQQEANLFARLQMGRRNMKPMDRFMALLQGEPTDPMTIEAVAIKQIAERNGFRLVAEGKGPRIIKSPSGLEAIYRTKRSQYIDGATALDKTLETIAASWMPDEVKSGDADLIKGIGLVFLRHAEEKLNQNRLIERLSELTPTTILARAADERAPGSRGGGGTSAAIYKVIVKAYNKGGGTMLHYRSSIVGA